MIPERELREAVAQQQGLVPRDVRIRSRRPMRGSYGGSGAEFERLRLDLAGRQHTAVLKRIAPDPIHAPVERRFYAELACSLRIRVPRAFGSGEHGEHGWVLLEAFPPVLQRAAWKREHLRAVARELARLHAGSLETALEWPARPLTRDLESFIAHVPEGVARLREQQERWPVLRPLASEGAMQIALALAEAPQRLRAALEASPQALIHRDFHPGNLVVPRDGSPPITFDWEALSIGPPIFDLTLFFQYLGLSWREWPALHLEITSYGPPPLSWEELRETYLDALEAESSLPVDRKAIANAATACFVWESLYRIGWVHTTLPSLQRWLDRWSQGLPGISQLAAWRADATGLRCRADLINDLEHRGPVFLAATSRRPKRS